MYENKLVLSQDDTTRRAAATAAIQETWYRYGYGGISDSSSRLCLTEHANFNLHTRIRGHDMTWPGPWSLVWWWPFLIIHPHLSATRRRSLCPASEFRWTISTLFDFFGAPSFPLLPTNMFHAPQRLIVRPEAAIWDSSRDEGNRRVERYNLNSRKDVSWQAKWFQFHVPTIHVENIPQHPLARGEGPKTANAEHNSGEKKRQKQFSGELTVRVLFRRSMLIGVDLFLSPYHYAPSHLGNVAFPKEREDGEWLMDGKYPLPVSVEGK